MELLNEPTPGVLELRSQVFEDSRGSFSETFSRRTMAGFGIDLEFCQDNESFSSSSGTVRGLHLQVEPHAQGKLVRVCLLYTSPSPRDRQKSRMPSSA